MDNQQTPQVRTNQIPLFEPLVLASGSPRRAEILTTVGWQFEKIVPAIDETPQPGEAPEAYVCRLAVEKAAAVSATLPNRIVLGADTTVVVDGAIVGKPETDSDAVRMLRALRGRWHEVLTGVALVRSGAQSVTIADHERTRVRFADMTDAEVDWYVATREPMDKAGAYAAQGCGALFVRAIEGDYWNVIGLPIQLVFRMVQRIETAAP
jgi:septum formation protein